MYALISFIVLLTSYFFFRKVSGSMNLKKLNMVSWVFWYSLLLQTFIASILVVYSIDQHYSVEKIYFESSRLKGWLAVQYCMVVLPLSMYVCMILTNRRLNNKKVLEVFLQRKLTPCLTEKDKVIRGILYLFSLICCGAVLYSFISVGSYPFKMFIQGTDNFALYRQEVTRGFSGNIYIKNVLALTLTPILSYIFYTYYRLFREKIDLFFFILTFFSALSIISFDYSKSPIAFYLIGFIFLKVSIGDSINYRKFISYFFLIIGLIVAYYLGTGYKEGVSTLFSSYNSGILGRILLSQASGLYLSFDYYPVVYDHIGFSSLSNIFGEGRERMARELMMGVNPGGILAGEAGVINTLFLAEAWANFGVLGVLFGVVWVGFFIQILYQFFINNSKNPIKIGIYAYLCYKLPITGGFNDFIYNPSLFLIAFIFVFIYFVSKNMVRS
ncbi:O-antigen polymerase [Acinetobacter sp. YH16058]|uniref:O-antigen polymerase n=1 Tax=Acinetobacter sp. YH16058 TaxID=2601196 RepID=UPI0015D41B7D|nr:O-antigen polymerase [Acinetobacter sp. YH16058]